MNSQRWIFLRVQFSQFMELKMSVELKFKSKEMDRRENEQLFRSTCMFAHRFKRSSWNWHFSVHEKIIGHLKSSISQNLLSTPCLHSFSIIREKLSG